MKKDALKKTIDFERDFYNRAWTGLIVTTSGTIAIYFSSNSVSKWFFFSLGLFLIVFFIYSCMGKNRLIKKLIALIS
jgi:hypothetical protein